MQTMRTSLLVVGAGPGGYVCAIRAAQLGINTAIVESEKFGGTCLNVGCIPSKAIIHAAQEFHALERYSKTTENSIGITAQAAAIDLAHTMKWKDSIVQRLNSGVGSLLKKAGVKTLSGHAQFLDGKSVVVKSSDGEVKVHCDNVVIATGSEPAEIPSLPFSEHVLDSTGVLSLTHVPKTLAVVGGGYIGLELGTSFAKLGADVTIVESAERILPQYDEQLTAPVASQLKHLGVKVLTNTRAVDFDTQNHRLCVEDSIQQQSHVDASKVLVTVGRKARLAGYGLEELSLNMTNNAVAIDEHCQTSMRGVYAIGDITGEPMLAHRAMAQAELVAARLSGQSVTWDKLCIPAVCFTDPEIVCVGLSPTQARERGIEIQVGEFPFMANGRAMSLQSEAGFIRVVSDAENHAVLGVQAVGADISELAAAFTLAIEMGARTDDIAMTIHAHPTMGEAFQEACMNALGHGLHL